MPRILSIDYGTKRCGIAATDPLQLIASALAAVETSKLDAWLTQYLSTEPVETIVVGKPMRLDGSETHSSKAVANFVTLLRKKYPTIPVVEIDERFTSAIAQRTMIDMGMKKKDRQNKTHIDQISAVLILQTYLQMKQAP
ncbi:MAG: Holliday junction resolvase RuvX [Bacteroidota bacterium]|jgi:putative Holliday junction resolvase